MQFKKQYLRKISMVKMFVTTIYAHSKRNSNTILIAKQNLKVNTFFAKNVKKHIAKKNPLHSAKGYHSTE